MSSFLPARKNFPFWRGSTFRYAFEWKDEILTEGKTVIKPHDLTNYVGLAILHPLSGEPGESLELSTENGGVIFGGYILKEPKNGLVELYVAQTRFESVAFKKANYTLFATEPNPPEDTFSLLSGRFTESGPSL